MPLTFLYGACSSRRGTLSWQWDLLHALLRALYVPVRVSCSSLRVTLYVSPIAGFPNDQTVVVALVRPFFDDNHGICWFGSLFLTGV